MTVRPLVEADHAEVLALDAAHVELLSPLDEPRLRELVGWADQALVVGLDGGYPTMCLEVNSDPPNVASLAFHTARGYEVAMMSKDLRRDPGGA